VLLVAAEKELKYDMVPIDLAKGEQKSAEHLKRQPFGKIPVYEDGNFRLFESRAIARYIAYKYMQQGTQLIGGSLEEKSVAEQWASVEGTINNAMNQILFNRIWAAMKGMTGSEDAAKRAGAEANALFDVLDAHLKNNQYLTGANIQLCDLSFLPELFQSQRTPEGQDILAKHPNVKAWLDRMMARPSAQTVFAMFLKK